MASAHRDVVAHRRSITAALCMPLLAAATAMAPIHALAVESYQGSAYATGTRTLLYRESHWIDGNQRVVLYRCPGGEPFARKRVDSGVSAAAPDFELLDARDGYREGVRSIGGKREVFVQMTSGAPTKRRTLSVDSPVIDAGFDAFVRDSWVRLADKRGLVAPFVIPSRLGAVDFRIRHVGDTAAGRKLRLSIAGWYGAVLPQIELVYAVAGRTLLHYRGIGNIRGSNGDHPVVDIEFPIVKRRHDVPRGEVDAAIATTLVKRCPS